MNIVHFNKNGEFSEEALGNAKDIVIAINSQNISVHEVTLPKMSNAKAIKAIPYALESRLLDDIDTLEFISIKSSKQNTWDIFVLSKDLLEGIENHLLKEKCKPVAILPDFMLLPFEEGSIHFHEKDGFISFRTGMNQGGCLDKQKFYNYFTESELIEADYSYSSEINVNIHANTSQLGLNDFIVAWRLPAILSIATLILAISQILINNNQLNEQLSQFKIKNEQQFQSMFPDIDRIVDIRAQTKQRLTLIRNQELSFQNDLLGKLASETQPSTRVKKISFENKILNLEVLK